MLFYVLHRDFETCTGKNPGAHSQHMSFPLAMFYLMSIGVLTDGNDGSIVNDSAAHSHITPLALFHHLHKVESPVYSLSWLFSCQLQWHPKNQVCPSLPIPAHSQATQSLIEVTDRALVDRSNSLRLVPRTAITSLLLYHSLLPQPPTCICIHMLSSCVLVLTTSYL